MRTLESYSPEAQANLRVVGEKAWDLQIAGYRIQDIHVILLNYYPRLNADNIWEAMDVYFEWRRRYTNTPAMDKQLALDRLDRMLLVLDPSIRAGSIKAISLALRVEESRRKLLGVDSPEKREIDLKGDTVLDSEIRSLIDEYEASH